MANVIGLYNLGYAYKEWREHWSSPIGLDELSCQLQTTLSQPN